MTHAPKFWAMKLPDQQYKSLFWSLIELYNFSGETAYFRTLEWFNMHNSTDHTEPVT